MTHFFVLFVNIKIIYINLEIACLYFICAAFNGAVTVEIMVYLTNRPQRSLNFKLSYALNCHTCCAVDYTLDFFDFFLPSSWIFSLWLDRLSADGALTLGTALLYSSWWALICGCNTNNMVYNLKRNLIGSSEIRTQDLSVSSLTRFHLSYRASVFLWFMYDKGSSEQKRLGNTAIEQNIHLIE